MGNDGSFVENQESIQDNGGIFGTPVFGGAKASKEMLKYGPTNRIIMSDRQGRLLNSLSVHIEYIKALCRTDAGKSIFKPLTEMRDEFQKLQMCRDSMTREDFKDVEIADIHRIAKKRNGIFNRSQPSTSNSISDSGDDF